MSTIIENGYRRRVRSLSDLASFLDTFRQRAEETFRGIYDEALARRSALLIDSVSVGVAPSWLGDPRSRTPLIDAYRSIQEEYTETKLPGGSITRRIAGSDVRLSVTPSTISESDFECALTVIPDGRWAYFLLHAEDVAYQEILEGMPGVTEYAWWDNTDHPANIPSSQWQRREQAWEKILGGRAPARRGWMLEVVGPLLPHPSQLAEVLPHVPSFDRRLSNVVDHAAIQRFLEERTDAKHSTELWAWLVLQPHLDRFERHTREGRRRGTAFLVMRYLRECLFVSSID